MDNGADRNGSEDDAGGDRMTTEWENDDEVVTTFRTIKMTQQENYDAGFAAGVAWARENAQ